jgi:anti-sigma-K factor RskA
MRCEEMSDLYELYALGVLDAQEKETLEEHLGRDCENCMREIKRALENNAVVFGAVPKMDPPPELRRRILAGFGLETRPLWARIMPWSVAVAAIAITLVLAVRQPHAETTNTAQTMAFLALPGTRQVSFGKEGPHGSVLMHQQKGMLLMVVNLPVAPAGKMYETWLVPKAGAPRPTGELKTEKSGEAVGLIEGPLDMATVQAVAVSLEPAGTSPLKPTTLVFAAPVSEN